MVMGRPEDKWSNVPRWRIHVAPMQHVRTQLDLTHVHAIKAGTLLKELLELNRLVPILMNVQIILTIVVITLVALTLMKILHASARKDTLVME